MVRQEIKNNEYFLNYFQSVNCQTERRKMMLNTGQVVPEREVWFKKSNLDILLDYTIAKYTSGTDILDIKIYLIKVIDYLKEGWSEDVVKLNYEGKIHNQYTLSAYDQMLWMFSLGYLLDIPNEDFQKLVDVIDRDQVKDFLFEFIIRAKVKDRKPITEESYEYGWILFGKLRKAIIETDKPKAAQLVKEFITRDWYKEYKHTGWYNSHKSPHDSYFGYWSFETAAVVKIMGLDDSSFIDCPYYPKDLVG
jgi:hypothetical protein